MEQPEHYNYDKAPLEKVLADTREYIVQRALDLTDYSSVICMRCKAVNSPEVMEQCLRMIVRSLREVADMVEQQAINDIDLEENYGFLRDVDGDDDEPSDDTPYWGGSNEQN